MIIDLDQLKQLINSDLSAYSLATLAGINKATIVALRNGKSDFNNMTIGNAVKLQNYYNKNGVIKMEMPKIKGLKKAVGEFNRWQGAARIYYDKNNMSVEVYVYGGTGEWEDFHDTNIVEVMQKATSSILERDDKTTMAELAKACQNA